MYSNKMQEVQKYISVTNHVYTPVALVASKKFWDTLSPADKAGIQKAAVEAGLLQRKLLDEGDARRDRQVQGGRRDASTTVTPAELARIQEKVKPVVAKFSPLIGDDFVKGFYAEIEKARAEVDPSSGGGSAIGAAAESAASPPDRRPGRPTAQSHR